mmetsp:Transcript_121844/g.389637  ORF Transcript_121844/g.389637 Transcript_121844/m.389637 type:complete len:482 (+) Transcript_121844:76-1521(+)|eukprot:CAMPEP_0203846324 /NCGR_PEP_ID=MMETSP0359-20131031/4351_1 /ASSEMBLY_ACC=CAM_ASM_000338 /TAXON_ID=268821 /ORGANISM="Scrippsiella Hangoei, Strain SHTV-5" /LENGTH=481 /DNA_ID=CAMNT_0050761619 /DNA_START=76 /DNA_END=1521 /DNA_ORIENTATION=-
MKSGSGAIRDCGPGGDVHHFVGKHTFVHVLEAEEDGPTMKSSSSEPSLSSQSADSSRSHDGLFRQRLQQVEDDRAAGIDPGGGFSAFANSGAGRESRLARGGSSRGGGSGSIRDCGPASGGSASHDYVIKHTFLHVLNDQPPAMQSSSSEPSHSSQSASSSLSQGALDRYRRRHAADGEDGGSTSSNFGDPGRDGRGRGRSHGAGSSGDVGTGGKGAVRGGGSSGVVSSSQGRGRGRSRGQPQGFEDTSEGHAQGMCEPCGFVLRGEACQVRLICNGCHHSQHAPKPRTHRPVKNKQEKYTMALQQGLQPIPNLEGAGSSPSGLQDNSTYQASGSDGQDLLAGHAEGTCVPCVFVARGEDCEDRQTCTNCHDPHHLAKYRSRRPCKSKRKKFIDALDHVLERINKTPDTDLNSIKLPSCVRDNASYKEKFVGRMRMHKDWLEAGGDPSVEASPAATHGPQLSSASAPPGPHSPVIRIKLSL